MTDMSENETGQREEAALQAEDIENIENIEKAQEEKVTPKADSSRPRRELVGADNKQMETKRLVIFLALCFGVAWALEFFAIAPLYRSNDPEAVKEAAEMISQMMFTPGSKAKTSFS